MSSVVAYYLSACSPSPLSGQRKHSTAGRQDRDTFDDHDWTELLRIEDIFDPHAPGLVAAILADHLGRPPLDVEIAAIPRGWLRFTPSELNELLAPTRQLTLEVPA